MRDERELLRMCQQVLHCSRAHSHHNSLSLLMLLVCQSHQSKGVSTGTGVQLRSQLHLLGMQLMSRLCMQEPLIQVCSSSSSSPAPRTQPPLSSQQQGSCTTDTRRGNAPGVTDLPASRLLIPLIVPLHPHLELLYLPPSSSSRSTTPR